MFQRSETVLSLVSDTWSRYFMFRISSLLNLSYEVAGLQSFQILKCEGPQYGVADQETPNTYLGSRNIIRERQRELILQKKDSQLEN